MQRTSHNARNSSGIWQRVKHGSGASFCCTQYNISNTLLWGNSSTDSISYQYSKSTSTKPYCTAAVLAIQHFHHHGRLAWRCVATFLWYYHAVERCLTRNTVYYNTKPYSVRTTQCYSVICSVVIVTCDVDFLTKKSLFFCYFSRKNVPEKSTFFLDKPIWLLI